MFQSVALSLPQPKNQFPKWVIAALLPLQFECSAQLPLLYHEDTSTWYLETLIAAPMKIPAESLIIAPNPEHCLDTLVAAWILIFSYPWRGVVPSSLLFHLLFLPTHYIWKLGSHKSSLHRLSFGHWFYFFIYFGVT